jgi:HNH endonuclease/Domain of unknown function (DUF222)
MDWEGFTTDQLEQKLLYNRRLRSGLYAEDIEILEVMDRRQVATADGCRNLSEWTAATLDIGVDTAQSLIRTMRRTVDRPDLREALAAGVSFDRIEAVSRIPENVGFLEQCDIAGVRHSAGMRARISSEDDHRTVQDRFLVLQPSLDESWWKLWGGLDGVSGAIVDKVLTEIEDQLPSLPDGTRGDPSWRKATALVELAISDNPPPAQISVFIDANQATPTNAQTGVELAIGPRIGREALQAILCEAVTEITVTSQDGTPMSYGRRTRTIPPALRRAILHRDNNRCAADGCDSRNRLQTHHITPWSEGGPTDPDNLITLCWYHHHIIIHQQGFQPYHHPKHGRIRFHKPGPRDPPE